MRIAGGASSAGVMAVNVAGCFAAGILMALIDTRITLSPEQKLFLFAGFLGAFTTFSAVFVEMGNLARSDQWLLAARFILLQNAFGIAALFTGLASVKMIFAPAS
ncbi:MAG: CrcB family protein [Planctomycetota bacterium]|nr:CrcB family protein [Planctomycetota bacterium]